jgi:hypothetical protein
MSKTLKTSAGIYERDTKSTKDWVIEMYAPNTKQNKWIVLAFPKVFAKSNGGYDYKIILTEELQDTTLTKLEESKIHFSDRARYVRALGMYGYDTAKFIADGMASRLKNIKVNIW